MGEESTGSPEKGFLHWSRQALSACTWCVSNKGHSTGGFTKSARQTWDLCRCGHGMMAGTHVGKADSDKCRCREVMAGTHVVEECLERRNWSSGVESGVERAPRQGRGRN